MDGFVKCCKDILKGFKISVEILFYFIFWGIWIISLIVLAIGILASLITSQNAFIGIYSKLGIFAYAGSIIMGLGSFYIIGKNA